MFQEDDNRAVAEIQKAAEEERKQKGKKVNRAVIVCSGENFVFNSVNGKTCLKWHWVSD